MIPTRLTRLYVAICEGTADEETFRRLVNLRRIRNIEFVSPDKDCGGHGKDYFYGALTALTTLNGYENVRGIVLIRDSDSNLNLALRELKTQIRKTNRALLPRERFTVPNSLLTPVFSEVQPPLICLTIPWIDQLGALETLILPAVEQNYPEINRCLGVYEVCSAAARAGDDWSIAKQSKMRLAALVAAICEADPTVSIQSMWSKDAFRGFLNHGAFDQLTNFFRRKSTFFKRPPAIAR